MGKELSEMTLKELWELFPIFLTKHNDAWAKNYEEMEVFIKRILSDYFVARISHIGSTAVKGIGIGTERLYHNVRETRPNFFEPRIYQRRICG